MLILRNGDSKKNLVRLPCAMPWSRIPYLPSFTVLAMASSLRAASHRLPVSASAVAFPPSRFSTHSAPVSSPFFPRNPRACAGSGLGANRPSASPQDRFATPAPRCGRSDVTGTSSAYESGGSYRRCNVSGPLLAGLGRGRVSTAAMAENLKNLRLDDGPASGAAADKVR